MSADQLCDYACGVTYLTLARGKGQGVSYPVPMPEAPPPWWLTHPVYLRAIHCRRG